MGFNNPRTPWAELAQKLSLLSGDKKALRAFLAERSAEGERGAADRVHGESNAEEVRGESTRGSGTPNTPWSNQRHAEDDPATPAAPAPTPGPTPGPAPAPVSVGPGASDRRSRYADSPELPEDVDDPVPAPDHPTPDHPPTDPEANGSDAPAWARRDRYADTASARKHDGNPADHRNSPTDHRNSPTDHPSAPTTPDTASTPAPTPRNPGHTSTSPTRATPPWAELHVHSDFSFLDGASEPEELVEAATRSGLDGLGLTDHNGLYGAVRFAHAAAEADLPTVFGAELSVGLTEKIPGQVDPQALHVLVLARGVAGYRRLSEAITEANMRGEKNRPVFDLEELAALTREHGDWRILTGCRKGLFTLTPGAAAPGARTRGTTPTRSRGALPSGTPTSSTPTTPDPTSAAASLASAIDLFGADNLAVELTHQGLPTDDERLRLYADLAAAHGVPAVATNAVHYATRARYRNAQVRAAVRSRKSLDEVAGWLPPAATNRIHSVDEMLRRFAFLGEAGYTAIANAGHIAAECAFGLRAARAGLPTAPMPAGVTEEQHLWDLVTAGALHRYGTREANPHAWEVIDKEMATIVSMGFCGYFLIVYDIARYCREHDIFCQGRGSAANSAVCYVLGITAVDAVEQDMLFERFLSPDRAGYPDIDIDIESARREPVIQYVYEHYGRDRAAQVANVITYRAKSAVRDAAAALGYAPGQQDAFSKHLHRWSTLPELEETSAPEAPADQGASSADRARSDRLRRGSGEGGPTPVPAPVLRVAQDLLNTPRHLGIHSGGMILADRPIGQVVPIEPATMEKRTVVQWDKDDCAAMDLVKFDLLGLGMLGALHEMVDLIERHTGERIDRAALPKDDPEVYDMLCRADAIGIFQVESRAQLATLPRLAPREFYDLAVQVALIRPGPIQGGSVHPYLNRRQGKEPVEYLHPLLEKSLGKTLGVPLFQEQLMQMAIDVAGFSGADADELRRAMGSRRSARRMAQLRDRFLGGCAERDVEPATAEVIFEKIAAFADYGFPESHAISFANLVHDSAWFKRYHHAAFTAGLLRSQPMGFYSPQSLVTDARRHGVGIRPVDVNASQVLADLEPDADSTGGLAIRIGLESVRHVGEEAAKTIVAAREEGGPFTCVEDLAHRTGVEVTVLEGLATAGAFECFGLDRRQALWIAGSLSGAGPDTLPGTSPVSSAPALPLMDDFDVTLAELFSTGLTVDGYPTEQLRESLRARGYLSTADAQATEDGKRITVAGIVTHRQRPATASGITFMNIEDEFGMLNVVCTPGLMKRFRSVSLTRNTLVVTGQLQRSDEGNGVGGADGAGRRTGSVVSLYAHKLVPLDVQVPVGSRNFR
ncbi:error-prone DNA polymerase [Brevibacterium litoralis]|uniref:error-prone DNA polymerase n=1 Tax=Brevibacterium litoralis TaxID=3138935 RepID=UPI0032EC551A